MYKCFFFNDTATTEIYTLSLHDALPIYADVGAPLLQLQQVHQRPLEVQLVGDDVAVERPVEPQRLDDEVLPGAGVLEDRKSTRLNSSHANISYAVFCLKKKLLQLQLLYY